MVEVPEINTIVESKKKSHICIVIPTYNQYEITKKTLKLLEKQSIEFDIVVVDNASTDETFTKLQQEFPDITILLSKKNYGGAGGLFLGQKFAYQKGYEYIILSDNDAIPIDSDLIEKIVDASDENHIVDFINVAEEIEPSIKIFHYGCYHRNIIKKIGFVEYRYFIYGDDVEFALRLEKYGIKRKSIEAKYYHPMKYSYTANRVYFDIRNELENAKRYKTRRKHTFNTLLSKLLFYLFYERKKLKVYFQAVFDWIVGKWDNSYIEKKLDNELDFKELRVEEFRKIVKKTEPVVAVCHHRLKSIIQGLEFECYSLKNAYKYFNKTFIQNVYTYPSLLSKKFFYIVSIDDGKMVYFEKRNNPLLNLLIITLLLPFFVIFLSSLFFALILKTTRKNILPDAFRKPDYWRYIEFINENEKRNDTAVLILSYNNLENVKKIAKYYVTKTDIVDVIIVDNNSHDGTVDYLLENYRDKFTIIKTEKNYGGAGGFCVGQEYVIDRGYNYCILTEEDAVALDEDLLDAMVEKREPTTIVKSKFYELLSNSFTLHFTLYPVELFKTVGVMNFDLFFRADDWEYGKRIENFLKKGVYKEIVVEKFYSHPLVKEGFGIVANYFSFRNGLLVYSKRYKKNFFIDTAYIFIKDLTYALFTLFHDKNAYVVQQFMDAYIDFLTLNIQNEKYILKYKGKKLEPDMFRLEEAKFDLFFNKFKECKVVSNTLRYNKHLQKCGISKKKLSCCIATKYAGVNRIFGLMCPQSIFIEHIDFPTKRFKYFLYDNKSFLYSRFTFFIAVSFAVTIYVCNFPIIAITRLRIR